MKTNRHNYVISTLLLIAVLATPVYAQQTNPAAATVSNKNIQADADDEQSKPNAYQLFGYGDPKMDSLSKQIDQYSRLMYNYDHSKAYETLNARAKGFSQTAPNFYNNDTLRRIIAGINKISEDVRTSWNRDLSLKKDSLGHLIGDYFKTEEFAGINAKLQKKYHIDPAKNYTSDNSDYRRYHDDLMEKLPEEIKNELKELKDLSEQYRNVLQSPEYVKNIKQLRILLDSLKNYYKTPQHTAQYTYASYEATMDVPADERKKARSELYNYMENPEFHQYSEMLSGYVKEMRDYYQNTPVVKEHEDAWKKELRTILGDDYDIILHPGRGLEHLYGN